MTEIMNASTSSNSFHDRIHEEDSNTANDGHLTFNVYDLRWKPSVVRMIDDRFQPSSTLNGSKFFLNSLRQRELRGSGLLCSRMRYKKALYKMNVRHIVKNARTKNVHTFFSPIDKKGMYLGLSHNSAHLVELSVDDVDPLTMISFLDCTVATGDESKFKLVIHSVTPEYLYPRYVLDLGHRSLLSVFHAGFSLDQRIFVSHCFSSNEHKYVTEGYTDSVYFDVALLEHNIHVSLQIVMNVTAKKRHLSKNSYFRIFNSGFVFDTGTEIVAVTFHDEKPDDDCNSQQIYYIQRREYNEYQEDKAVQGMFLRNMTVRSSLPDSDYLMDAACRREGDTAVADLLAYELIPVTAKTEASADSRCSSQSKQNGTTCSAQSTWNVAAYITEVALNADHVINTVVRSVLKTRLQNYKFMGITAAEAYIIGMREHIVQVIVIGVIELQSARYVFTRVAVELDWNLQKPDKMSLINLSVREINWQTATRGEWRPSRLQIQRNVEDRLLTNDVNESLKYLVCTLPGGMCFSA